MVFMCIFRTRDGPKYRTIFVMLIDSLAQMLLWLLAMHKSTRVLTLTIQKLSIFSHSHFIKIIVCVNPNELVSIKFKFAFSLAHFRCFVIVANIEK